MNASVGTAPYYEQQPNTGCAFCDSIHRVINAMTAWLAAPFTAPISAVSLILIVGLVSIAAWFWHWVLLTIREEV